MGGLERMAFASGREDGRFVRTEEFVHDYLKRLRPKLAFPEHASPSEFALWQDQVRQKLKQLLKFPDTPPQPEPKHLWTESRDGYRLEKWECYPEEGSVVPFLMLVPDGASPDWPAPAVLCSPGSLDTKEFLAGEPEQYQERRSTPFSRHEQMAVHYARQGMVAVAVDNPGIGELKRTDQAENREYFALQMLKMGRNYMGLSVFQKLNIVDWLKGLSFVNAGCIALSAHSLSTVPNVAVGLLDPAVKAIVYSDGVCDNRIRRVTAWREEPDWYTLPDLFEWFTVPDLLAAFAPRPLLVLEGGVTADLHKVGRAYENAGKRDNFEFHYYPKYADPDERKYDFAEIPEGLTTLQYHEYANIDAPDHYFKEYWAVPWLKRVFGMD